MASPRGSGGRDPWSSWSTLFWVLLWTVALTACAIGIISGKVKL